MPAYVNAIHQALLNTVGRWQQTGDNWFDVDLDLPQGVIQIAAEVIFDGNSKTLALFDVAIYPKDNGFVIGTAASEFREAMRDLKTIAQSYGLSVTIIGQRVSNSSSARPGHVVQLKL